MLVTHDAQATTVKKISAERSSLRHRGGASMNLEKISCEAKQQSCALFNETGVLCPIHEGKLDRNLMSTSLTSVL